MSQGVFFITMAYPFIWWFSQGFMWTHLTITPILLFWSFIDDRILICGVSDKNNAIPCDNYAAVYISLDSITAMLYGDTKWLYKGRSEPDMDFEKILYHHMLNLINFLLTPFLI